MTGHDGGVVDVSRYTAERYRDLAGSVCQRWAWAQLSKRAQPVLDGWHQDLIHDWAALRTYWHQDEIVFYWAVRPTGTSMSTSEHIFRQMLDASEHVQAWKVTIRLTDRGTENERMIGHDPVFEPFT